VFHVRPFHGGWRVDVDDRPAEILSGDRDRAIEIARYQATLRGTALVLVHGAGGAVDERIVVRAKPHTTPP
jgi:hypothetical protein